MRMNDLWRHRNFLLLLSSHALGRLAATLFTVGLMVDVFRKTGSALGIAAVMLASTGFAALADYLPIRGIYLIGGGLYAVTALYALSSPALRDGRIEVGR